MAKHNHSPPKSSGMNRRRFLSLAALGSASLLVPTPWMPRARAKGGVEALLLSCMDYRLLDDIVHYMNGRGLKDKYDHVILAGASLGATTERYPAWNETFWQHLEIAIQLHKIKKVMIMDHRDCGAYKVILGPEHLKSPEVEKETHAQYLKKLGNMVRERYPKLEIELLLMNLDGSVTPIPFK